MESKINGYKVISINTGNKKLDDIMNNEIIFSLIIDEIAETHPNMNNIKLVIPHMHYFESCFAIYREYLENNFPCKIKHGDQIIYLYDDFDKSEKVSDYEMSYIEYKYNCNCKSKSGLIQNNFGNSTIVFYIREEKYIKLPYEKR